MDATSSSNTIAISPAPTPPPKTSPPKTSPPRRRLPLLIAALLVVTIVNAARVVRVQEYFQLQLSQDVSTATDESESETDAHSKLSPIETLSGCSKLEKSHIDPNFYRADTCLTRDQILSIIKELVFTTAEVFEAHNITYFLDSGTLLGAFRSEQVIVHDNDADVGIDAAGLDYIRTNSILFPAKYAFTVWNSSLYPTSDRDDKLPARLIHRDSGIYVDVFAFLDSNDPKTGAAMVGPLPSWCFHNCAGCPKVASGGKLLQVARDWIYPVVNCTFEGRTTLKCPHKTEEYLRYTFGKNYMTPIKYTYG